MDGLIANRPIHRFFEAGRVEELEDELVQEYPLSILLDGEDFVKVMVFPSLMEEFLLGFLATRGLIRGVEDVSLLEVSGNIATIQRVREVQGLKPSLNLLETTGTRNIDLKQFLVPNRQPSGPMLRVPVKVLIEGVLMLSRMPLYSRTGGTHCAMLFSPEGEVVVSAEDIGRHNCVDKVIGGGLKKGIDFARFWLAVSGRLPADMVLKAALVGIPLIASVSAPTSEGVNTGEKAGVTVVGFAREGRLNCYCHHQRIIP